VWGVGCAVRYDIQDRLLKPDKTDATAEPIVIVDS